jgi:periplasmic copper chaperone A
MRLAFPAALMAALVTAATLALAHHYTLGAIRIEHPWARATAATAKTAAAYFVLSIEGEAGDRLVGLGTPAAERAEIHVHETVDGVASMKKLDAVEIVPGSPTVFAPGGLHVMLFGLKAPLAEYATFPLTLAFERAGSITVEVQVEEAGALEPAHEGEDHDDGGES